MLMLLLNLICLAVVVWNTISPSFALAHPSVCYHGLVWAHVTFGMMMLMVPTATMRDASKTWIVLLQVPLLPTGIRALNTPVIFLLVMFFAAFGQFSLAAAIPCQAVVMYLYRKRHDRLVDIVMQPVVATAA